MKRIVVASGKGGTGKTTIAINMAYALSKHQSDPVQLLDCDVEAPNDNLFLNASFNESRDVTITKPVWDSSQCTLCGNCISHCNFNALAKVKDKILVFNELCHSCGACLQLCPTKSFVGNQVSVGKIELAPGYKPFSFGHGILAVGESLAPTIIKELKKNIDHQGISILDAPPGTTCPVVESLQGANYCILVTEPTPFGLNDLKLAVNLAAKLKIPVGIVINRSYGNDEIIHNFAKERKIPIIGKIPFERKYAESYSQGKILVEEHPELDQLFYDIYQTAKQFPTVPKLEDNTTLPETTEFTLPESAGPKVKEIAIISGKGGTGKTTVTSSLSELIENKVMVDNDVDASNLHLLKNPKIIGHDNFYAGLSFSIDQDLCNRCGLCASSCQFDAIESQDGKYYIDEIACEGCGLCAKVCPDQVISSEPAMTGKWFISQTNGGMLSHAKLGVGEENSGKLVAKVREHAALIANKNEKILSDGPPGTGCPVIASITGVDMVLIVAEATISGFHDMRRALDLTSHFHIPAKIIINKFDLNHDVTKEITTFAQKNGSKVIGKIPFDKSVHDALVAQKTVISFGKGKAYDAIQDLWKNLKEEFK